MAKKGLKKGKFITFEGPEGSGKSTQAKMLVSYLRRKGFSVLHTREPGGTKISEKIRKILLDPKLKEMTDICEALLYLASRAQIVKEKILPALKKGKIVICDRFHDATVAYQGYGNGLDLGLLKRLGDFTTSGLKPDLTILLDIETKEGLRRACAKDRIEKKAIAFHRRLRRGYLKIAKQHTRRVRVISTKGAILETQKLIRKYISNVL